MAWTWLTDSVDLSGSITNDSTWRTLSLSGIVPAGTKAVILGFKDGDESGFRPTGSSMNRLNETDYGEHIVVPLDGSLEFEYNVNSNGTFTSLLLGYTDSGEWQTDYPDQGPSVTGAYQDVDLSSLFSAGATIAFFEGEGYAGGITYYAFRKNGTSYDYYLRPAQMFNALYLGVAGLDGSRICQHKVSNLNNNHYFIGGCNEWVVFDSPPLYTLANVGQNWTDLQITDVPTGTEMVILQSFNLSGGITTYHNVRRKGSIDSITQWAMYAWGHKFFFCGLDEDKYLQYVNNGSAQEFRLIGYYPSATPPPTYKRKFPVFDKNQVFETQADKMRFPCLT